MNISQQSINKPQNCTDYLNLAFSLVSLLKISLYVIKLSMHIDTKFNFLHKNASYRRMIYFLE